MNEALNGMNYVCKSCLRLTVLKKKVSFVSAFLSELNETSLAESCCENGKSVFPAKKLG